MQLPYLATTAPEDFETIADKLLNHSQLDVDDSAITHTGEKITITSHFRILEVEFYLQTRDHHDPYVHCDADQLSVGKWYFHKKGQSYRNGSFKGLDLTFGAGVYGGILIRSLRSADGTVIEGPCNSVHAILRAAGSDDIPSIVRKIASSDVLRIVPLEPADNQTVYSSSRVGLSATKAPMYANAPYRYLIYPHLIKKKRAQILAGLVEHHGFTLAGARALVKQGSG